MCYSFSLKAVYEDEEAAAGGSSASEDLVALLISRNTILFTLVTLKQDLC